MDIREQREQHWRGCCSKRRQQSRANLIKLIEVLDLVIGMHHKEQPHQMQGSRPIVLRDVESCETKSILAQSKGAYDKLSGMSNGNYARLTRSNSNCNRKELTYDLREK